MDKARVVRIANKFRNNPIATARVAIETIGNAFKKGLRRAVAPALHRYLHAGEHTSDGMTTRHNADFIKSKRFQCALAAASEANEWAPRIPWRIHQAMWCASITRNIKGDIVELGTGKGMLMSAVLASYPDWEASDKSIWLVDTFKPFRVDEAGEQAEGAKIHKHYAESADAVRKTFAPYERVNVVEGWVPECLDQVEVDSISFLHIDLNYPDPEVAGLRYFWERLTPGGVVLLDDYGYGSGFRSDDASREAEGKPVRMRRQQYLGMQELAAELDVMILSTPTGQGILVKGRDAS